MLIIKALSGSEASLNNLSDSDDTDVLKQALEENLEVKDVGHAGTAISDSLPYLFTRRGGSNRFFQDEGASHRVPGRGP